WSSIHSTHTFFHSLWTDPADDVWTRAGSGGHPVGYRSPQLGATPGGIRWMNGGQPGTDVPGRVRVWTTEPVEAVFSTSSAPVDTGFEQRERAPSTEPTGAKKTTS